MKNKKGETKIKSNFDFISSLDNIKEFRMSNGLKVLLIEDHMAPVATVLVLYKVGSRNEAVGNTGSTHFLEHMLFKGTKKHNPEYGNGIDELLTQVGAHWNATTWFDRTTYYEIVPKEHLKLCLKLEADRMRNLRLRQDDHDSEMTVVRNELERGENFPEDAMEKEMYAIAFREHPYHHPTIGWRSDVEGVSMDKLKDFYNTFYWPNNSCLIVAGDFLEDEALEYIDKYFGKITKSPHPIPDVYTNEPAQEGMRQFEIKRVGDLARIWLGFHVPEAAHEDNYTIALIKQILGSSSERASRLYKRLIDTNLACDVFTRHDELKDPSLFIIGAMVNEGVSVETVKEAILDEISKLQSTNVSDEELNRYKTANLKGTILSTAKVSNLAFMLAEAESKVDWRWLMEYDENFNKIDVESIKRVAKTYFRTSNMTLGLFTPLQPDELTDYKNFEKAINIKEYLAHSNHNDDESGFVPKINPLKIESDLDDKTHYQRDTIKYVFDNGLKLLFYKTKNTKSIAISGAINTYDKTLNNSNINDMTAEILASGTKNYSKDKLATILEEMSIPSGLDFHCDKFKTSFGTTLVNDDLENYLTILFDVLKNPLFLDEELEKCRIEWLNQLNEAKHNTRLMASNKYSQILYPKNHTYYDKPLPDLIQDIQNTSRVDLQEFHSKLYAPNSCVITIIGDLDFEELKKCINHHIKDWKQSKNNSLVVDSVDILSKTIKENVVIPNKTSSDIIMGHLVNIKRHDNDFFALRIACNALGGDTITARLGHVVRAKAGLTYGIYCGLQHSYLGFGSFNISLTVNPKNVDKAIDLTLKVYNDYLDNGISKAEITKEVNKAIGSFKVGLSSPMALANVMTELEFYGLGLKELDSVAENYRKLNIKSVNEAITKHLSSKNLAIVVAGS